MAQITSSSASFLMNTAILYLTEVGQIVGNFLRGITKLTVHRENMNQDVHSNGECFPSALAIGS